MKYLKSFLLASLLIISFTSVSMAAPVFNQDNDGTEDLLNGAIYATYVNSGTFLFLQEGNNEGKKGFLAVQSALNSIAGYEGIVLSEVSGESVTYTGAGSSSGTWEVNPSGTTIDFYIVKAANAYAMYTVSPAASTGSWSTFNLWSAGYGGKYSLDISHFTGYNPNTPGGGDVPVPVPATIILLGSGLLGLVSYGRMRIKA